MPYCLTRKGPTGNGKNTVFNQIYEIENQANGMVLDISGIGLTDERVFSDLKKAFSYRSCSHLDIVIVIKNGEIIKIIERT